MLLGHAVKTIMHSRQKLCASMAIISGSLWLRASFTSTNTRVVFKGGGGLLDVAFIAWGAQESVMQAMGSRQVFAAVQVTKHIRKNSWDKIN